VLAKPKDDMKECVASIGIGLFAATSAFGQMDESSLRAKYGAPLDRETFMVRPGIEMVVDYGPSRQVCRIQLPSGMKIVGSVPSGWFTKQQIDEVLGEVVPPSIRGKQLNGFMMATGAGSALSLVEYENVSIGEVGPRITVTFKDSTCPKKTVQ
jgi:hypothetical protein